MPRKGVVYSYPMLKDTIKSTFDRKTVAACITIALEKWRSGEFADCVFADLLYTAAKKYIDIE